MIVYNVFVGGCYTMLWFPEALSSLWDAAACGEFIEVVAEEDLDVSV